MIEKIIKFSVTNRYLVLILTLMAAGYGLYCLKYLPIDAVPDITNNQVQINTVASGFSPSEVEKQITFPIENSLSGIPGLETTRSLSRNGFSQVTAIFDDRVNIYFARQQIAEKLNEAKESLPEGIDPAMGPIATGLSEIYMWTVEYAHPDGVGAHTQPGRPGWQGNGAYLTPEGQKLKTSAELEAYLRTVQDWIIRPQLKRIPGLAEIDSIGGYTLQYHVEPSPEKMLALGITFQDILQALKSNNLNVGAGYIEQNSEAYVVKGDGRIENPEQIGEITLRAHHGTSIKIRDVADVVIGKELRSGSASENGREIVIGTAMMLIGGNSRTIAQAVDQKMQHIQHSLPPDIRTTTVLNRTTLVDATIETVIKNLAEGALLVICILFLMLGNFRAAFVTACVIPLSMLLTAAGMLHSKISGNLMSLGALDFGLIVDGAVIITENCLRRIALHQEQLNRTLNLQERLDEIYASAKEMVQPTVYGQLIILIVYFPLLTFSGVEGKMFEPMALTVIFALIAAFILSITFIPALLAILLSTRVTEKENWLVLTCKNVYCHFLEKALHRPLAVASVGSLFIICSAVLFLELGQEFVPTLDEKDLAINVSRIPSTSLTQSTSMQLVVEKTLKSFPEVALVFSKTGTAEMASDPMPPNVSDTFVMLKPRSEWPNPYLSKAALIEKLENALEKLPGNNYEFTQPIELRFNELIAGVKSDVAVKVYGDDFDLMQKTAHSIAHTLSKIPGTADVQVAHTHGLPVLQVNVKREEANKLGIPIADIFDLISIAVGGSKAGILMQGDRSFDLLVRLPEHLRHDVTAIGNLPLPLPHLSPMSIPLREVAMLDLTEGLNEISREDGKRIVTVQTNVRGTDLGSFVKQAKEKIQTEVSIPPGYWLEWGGQFEHLISSRERLFLAIPLCFFLIFLLLLSALHSVRESLVVFTGVPFALTGGIASLWLCGIPFSISAAAGFIALSGIAVLNGLVMMSCIQQLMKEGMPTLEAIFKGALIRFRPVLMTALVASLGFLPMALATGTGAEVQKPLAIVVIGGLITSTFLTLFVLPVLCKLFLRPNHQAAKGLEQ
ncbi:nickel and cobalt resistance protein CnrA [Parachlamydia acanthamoebae UV-7]|uniref:Nickel and cobalt resistance protein CnrA n=1 Tax=Parachlamydia acanthamoebae (strain UV7) TaxID=765952 RepID=F8L0N7_PARAV|nr:CusA/CzcA family heavy metal efflux RND transporter [Parachlamydia acanthamoebae]CCB86787.1 nickel and cobalt resistance protein CnrA [Parachlamydia acanthamoebae UV-7]